MHLDAGSPSVPSVPSPSGPNPNRRRRETPKSPGRLAVRSCEVIAEWAEVLWGHSLCGMTTRSVEQTSEGTVKTEGHL